MAKHIPFGEPINEAERWAFSYLKRELPEDYLLLTNVDLITATGQPLEIDAVVLGEYAVYLIDVKGYVGHLEAGVNYWRLDGRETENSFRKISQNSRILAGKLRRRAAAGMHVPWCQGMVLITGRRGAEVSITYPDDPVPAFSPDRAVEVLTSTGDLTSSHVFALTDDQRNLVLRTLGQAQPMEKRRLTVQRFTKGNRLMARGGFQIWEATLQEGDVVTDWLLKTVLRADCESDAQRTGFENGLRREFGLLQQLVGLAGVSYAAPLIDTGEELVLPIRRPTGRPLSDATPPADPGLCRLILLRAAMALHGIHRRGCTVGVVGPNTIYLDVHSDIQFTDVSNIGSVAEDCRSLVHAFQGWWEITGSESVQEAAAETKTGNAELEILIESLLDGGHAINSSIVSDFEPTIETGAVIEGRYKLLGRLPSDNGAALWRARHLLGQFECALEIFDAAEESWESVRVQYEQFVNIYHPSVERVFDLQRIARSDYYFLSRAWVIGQPLSEVEDYGADDLTTWVRQIVSALQYLHGIGVTHRNIRPENIVVEGDKAVLVGFSRLPAENHLAGDIRFKYPAVLEEGWTPYSDLYALAASILDVASENDRDRGTLEPNALLRRARDDRLDGVSDSLRDGLVRLLENPGAAPPSDDYLGYLGLELNETVLTTLPLEFRRQWGISQGYMEFLVVDMLNDPRPRARTQWVLHALRSRRIPGNRTNRGSMNATVSRLKAAGIAEDYGKKVRLTKSFTTSFDSFNQNGVQAVS